MTLLVRNPQFIMAVIILLLGCQQQSEKSNIPTSQVQINQLSALIASGQYIKENCQRPDIPDASQLHQTALYLAQLRGWNIQVVEYQELVNMSQVRYQELLQDGTSKEQKCEQFNSLLADFIYKAQRYKK